MNLYSVQTGNFKLDGGAMFGVVPKAIWEKTNQPDSLNRISMSARSLLIEDGNRLILVDTGLGNKQPNSFFKHYALWGNYNIKSSLKEIGFHPDDITDVLLTHLHFDHCGGAIKRGPKGMLVPSFKNAHYWVHEGQWGWAQKPNIREKASFLPENIEPIESCGQLKLIKGKNSLTRASSLGFNVLIFDGHTERQMLPVIEYKEKTIVFAADLIPTVGHIPVPYIMSYDTRPLLTLEEKGAFLKKTEKGVRLDYCSTIKDFF
jgi:glyoxylase-like metal-dependent hydrolase (beta-lactamase superfamily II)